MRDISQLHPKLQSLVYQLIEECSAQGLQIAIGECYRTVEEQNALYTQGRSKPGSKVTNARGDSYSSMHQWGVAFDIYRNDGKGIYYNADSFFQRVGKIGQSLGLEWGGSWTSLVDLPHFQLPDWGTTPTDLKQKYKNPDNFKKTWVKEEDAPMTQSEKQQFNQLIDAVKALQLALDKHIAEKHMIYDYVDNNMPKWCVPIIQAGIKEGLIKGTEHDANGKITKLGLTMQDIKAIAYDLREMGYSV